MIESSALQSCMHRLPELCPGYHGDTYVALLSSTFQ